MESRTRTGYLPVVVFEGHCNGFHSPSDSARAPASGSPYDAMVVLLESFFIGNGYESIGSCRLGAPILQVAGLLVPAQFPVLAGLFRG
jgi:hypothetical protein